MHRERPACARLSRLIRPARFSSPVSSWCSCSHASSRRWRFSASDQVPIRPPMRTKRASRKCPVVSLLHQIESRVLRHQRAEKQACRDSRPDATDDAEGVQKNGDVRKMHVDKPHTPGSIDEKRFTGEKDAHGNHNSELPAERHVHESQSGTLQQPYVHATPLKTRAQQSCSEQWPLSNPGSRAKADALGTVGFSEPWIDVGGDVAKGPSTRFHRRPESSRQRTELYWPLVQLSAIFVLRTLMTERRPCGGATACSSFPTIGTLNATLLLPDRLPLQSM